jgi:hypothetical protein
MNHRLFAALTSLILLVCLGKTQFSLAQTQPPLSTTSGSWGATTPLPEALGQASAVFHNGSIYLAGGEGPPGSIRTTVYYATIQADGSLGAWNTAMPLPQPRHYHALTRAKGYFYLLGGSPASSTVYSARINPDGSLNAWQTALALPVALSSPTLVTVSGKIYVMGGHDGTASQTTVYYATVNANGSLDVWNPTTPLPQALSYSDAIVNNGYIYLAGGYTGSGYTNAAYSVVVNPDGTLGNWNILPVLPKAIGNHVVIHDTFNLYVAGGWDGSASQSAVYVAGLRANGTLGNWTAATDLPQPLHDQASASSGDYLYILGGFNHGLPAFQKTVYVGQFAAFACSNVTTMPQLECEALVGLYNGTNGSNWVNKTNWLVTNTPCSWYGVTCANGQVTKLLLESNQLNGPLPPELGNLANLTVLDLSSNQLNGAIPTTLGNLSALTRLELDSNQLTGPILMQLGTLTNLERLDLHLNQLSGSIPAQLDSLSALTQLYLSDNQLSGYLLSLRLQRTGWCAIFSS